jgi:uncharacterized protein (DUF4415 family)
MAKKLPESSRRGGLVSVKAEDILAKPLTRVQRADLARLKKRPESEIDFSEIPQLTDEQLATAFQPNRQLIAVRLDRDVLSWLRSFGPGYSTRINNILRVVMENAVSSEQGGLRVRRRARPRPTT